MLADTGDTFCLVLNSQTTGQNVQTINSNGYKKYSNNLAILLPERLKNKKMKISANFISQIALESSITATNLYMLEITTGNNIQTLYQNGSASQFTNSILVPIEVFPSAFSSSAILSSYFFAKTNFTGRIPTETIEVKIHNASDFSINSSFPNYILQLSFEPVLETTAF